MNHYSGVTWESWLPSSPATLFVTKLVQINKSKVKVPHYWILLVQTNQSKIKVRSTLLALVRGDLPVTVGFPCLPPQNENMIRNTAHSLTLSYPINIVESFSIVWRLVRNTNLDKRRSCWWRNSFSVNALNTLRPRQIAYRFPDDTVKCIFLHGKCLNSDENFNEVCSKGSGQQFRFLMFICVTRP